MYKTLQDFVGNTPLVRLVRIPGSEMPKKFMIRPPATRKPDIRKNV